MDPLTHALSGAVLGMLGRERNLPLPADEAGRKAGRGLTLAVVAGSVFPDVDIVALIGGTFSYFKYHRGPTHSLAGILVLSALLAFLVSRFYPELRFRRLYLWSLLGMAAHVSLDLLTSYSTFILLPFSREPFFSGLLRFSDRIGWYVFGGAVLLGLALRLPAAGTLPGLRRLKPLHLAAAALLVFGSYVGAKAWVRWELKGTVADRYSALAFGKVSLTSNSPDFFDWYYTVDSPDALIVGSISRSDGTVREAKRFPKDSDPRFVRYAMKSDYARAAAAFSPYVFIRTEKNGAGTLVSFADLRYGPEPRIRAEILVNDRGDVLEEAYLGFGRSERAKPGAKP